MPFFPSSLRYHSKLQNSTVDKHYFGRLKEGVVFPQLKALELTGSFAFSNELH